MTLEKYVYPGRVINGFKVTSLCESTQNSSTFFGYNTSDEQQVVLKVYKNNPRKYLREIAYLEKFNSNFILKPIQTFDIVNNLKCSVFPRAQEKDLLDFLDKTPEFPIPEKKVRNIAYVLFKSVEYLNQNGVMHRDYKPENVVIMNSNLNVDDIKVIDLGMACKINDRLHQERVGSCYYAAPEVYDGAYSKECDIFSIGVTLCVACGGTVPFDCDSNKAMQASKKKRDYKLEGKIWNHFSNELKELIYKCLEPDPKKRITIDQIFSEYSSLWSLISN